MLKIHPKNYKLFIGYAMATCDSVSLVFGKNDAHDTEYNFQEEYYMISESVLRKESVHVHPDTGSSFNNADILYLKTASTVASLLMKANDIFDWNGDGFPEELCFYRKGVLWFSCTNHERLLIVYNETNADVEFFEKNKIKFTFEPM